MSEHEEETLPAPPAPAASFRGALGRRLASEAPAPSRPARLWLWIGLTAAVGAVLLLIALAGV